MNRLYSLYTHVLPIILTFASHALDVELEKQINSYPFAGTFAQQEVKWLNNGEEEYRRNNIVDDAITCMNKNISETRDKERSMLRWFLAFGKYPQLLIDPSFLTNRNMVPTYDE